MMRSVSLWAALAVAGCRATPSPMDSMPPAVPPSNAGQAQQPAVRTVVLVSIDGLRSDVIDPHTTPTLVRLRGQGASTLNARTDPLHIYTLPNHICMVTGLPVEGAFGHHFTINWETTSTVHDTAERAVLTAFDVAHRHGRTTALWASKRKLDVLSRTAAVSTWAPATAAFTNYDDEATVTAAIAGLAEAPALAMVHFSAPDSTGHGEGFDPSPDSAYRAAVTATDARLARLVEALPPEAALIVTTDHGGHGNSHGDVDEPADYTIPFIVVGGGAAPGADLYAINPTARAWPARAPAWRGEPVRNCEAGNLALRMLGLPPVPGSIYGARFDLRVAPN